ncbi:MAG: hypothetical protein QXU34_05085 [Ignisphaera sp.]
MKTLEIVDISQRSGGSYRAFKVLQYRGLYNIECYSILLGIHEDRSTYLSALQSRCRPIGYAYLRTRFKRSLLSRLHELISPIEVVYDKVSAKDVDVVIGHHETIDCIKAASDISNILNVRKVLVLQLPPFYGNSIRRKKIEDAYMLYIDMVRRWGMVLDTSFDFSGKKLIVLLKDPI